MINIEIWFDIACPYCYIGKINLKNAISHSGVQGVKIKYRSFELDPDIGISGKQTLYEELAEKYSISVLEAHKMTEAVIKLGKQVGIDFNFDNLIPTNTFNAHRLIHYANSKGKSTEMASILYKAYFTDALNIGRKPILVSLGESCGFVGKDVEEMLDSEMFVDSVLEDQQLAAIKSVDTVPYYLINGERSLVGAISVDDLAKEILLASSN